ncbi:MAG: hypothetical protein AAFX87_12545 [Bacteroidota bacterium]
MEVQVETHGDGNRKIFGIISLILAIFSLFFSLIPCVGFYAFIPAFIALVFGLISFVMGKKHEEKVAIPLIAMVIAGFAIALSVYQYFRFQEVYEVVDEFNEAIEEGIKNALDSAIQDSTIIRYDSIPADSTPVEPNQ